MKNSPKQMVYSLQVSITKDYARYRKITSLRNRAFEDVICTPIHITQGWYEVEVIASSEEDAYEKAIKELKKYKEEKLLEDLGLTPKKILAGIKLIVEKKEKSKQDYSYLDTLFSWARSYLGCEHILINFSVKADIGVLRHYNKKLMRLGYRQEKGFNFLPIFSVVIDDVKIPLEEIFHIEVIGLNSEIFNEIHRL